MAAIRLPPSLLAICAAGVLALSTLTAPAQALAQARASEPELKAAIISNMLLFVDWPARNSSADDPMTICYQGNSPVVAALIGLDGKKIKGRSLHVVAIQSGGAAKCQALYIAPGNAATLEKALGLIGSSPVFIASDSPDYFQHGTMLNLELVSGRIVFDIDLRSAQKAGLQLSSKALRLARQVIE
jgi:uncharacterized protein (DUF779 family)